MSKNNIKKGIGKKRTKTKYEIGDIVKFIGKVSRKSPQAYPKNNKPFHAGEHSILRFEVVSTDEIIPIPINFYGNVSIAGIGLPHNFRNNFDKEYYIVAKVKDIHDKYGYSFSNVVCTENLDINATEDTQRGFFKGILTETQFENLFAVYDKPLKYIVSGDTEALMKVKGLGEVTVLNLFKKYESNKAYIKAYAGLADYEISVNSIKKVVDYFHSAETAIEIIKSNPYKLVEIVGFSFAKADDMARNVGIDRDSPERLRAYILFLLDSAYDNGYSYLESDVLINHIDEDLFDTEFTVDEIAEVVIQLREEKLLVDGIQGLVGLSKHYYNEKAIAKELKRIINGKSYLNEDKEIANTIIESQQKRNGWEYSDEQRDAIEFIMDKKVGIVTGRGGCVDSETEYFNGVEWKQICDYTEGEKVLQYNSDGEQELTDIEEYHNYELEENECLVEFNYGRYGKQVLSLEHKMVYIDVNQVADIPTTKIDYLKITVAEFLKLDDDAKSTMYIMVDNMFINVEYHLLEIRHLFSNQLEDNYKYCFTVPSGMLILRRDNRIFITGNSGKTSIADVAVKALNPVAPRLSTLSGKASARIQQVSDFSASTIHRLLGFNPQGWGVDEETGRMMYFTYHEKCKMPYDVIVIDEFSMVDAWLLLNLLKAISTSTKLIFLGDVSQLNAIRGAKLGIELLESKTIPVFELTKLFRQKDGSQIKNISLKVAKGEQLYHKQYEGVECEGEVKDLVTDIFLSKYNNRDTCAIKTFDYYKQALKLANGDTKRALMITTVTTRGDSSVYNLNNMAQEYLNPTPKTSPTNGKSVEIEGAVGYATDNKDNPSYPFVFRINDRVMIIKNDYSTEEVELVDNEWKVIFKPWLLRHDGTRDRNLNDDAVFNGFGGTVIDATYDEKDNPKDIIVYVDDIDKYIAIPSSLWDSQRGLVLFYACTAHKFQGSEVDYAVLALSTSGWTMLNRQILYVMLSRGKEKVWLVAENEALHKAIDTSETVLSQAYLRHFLDYGTVDNILDTLDNEYEDDISENED